jgi:uncharacterized membrane protein YeaQ/YmgE (transglycosylase-associated protein family)
MSILIFIVAGVLSGIAVRILMPRSGVGGWPGDVMLGLLGAGLGTYMITSYNMGHALDNIDMLTAVNAFGTAIFILVVIHWLSRRMPEAPDADAEDFRPVEQ